MQVQPISNNQQTFGVRIKNRQVKVLVREIKEVSEPFLKAQKPYVEQIDTLDKNISKDINLLQSYRSIPEYNTAEFKEVKRLRLGEIDEKLKEYAYLRTKSQRYFVSPEVFEYAKEIAPLFEIPKQLVGPYRAYKQLQRDIHNGFYGKNLPADLKKKYDGLYDGRRQLICLTSPYLDVKQERRNVDKYLSTGIRDTKKFKRSLDNIYDTIQFYNNYSADFNKRIMKADELYNKYGLTQKDVELISIDHQQKVISHCVSKFNKKVADISLTEQDNIALTEKLQRQQEALETLWNKIEECKKKAFAPHPEPKVIHSYPDDMPF